MHLQACWAQVDLLVRLESVPALAFNVMHMQDGHMDLVGKNSSTSTAQRAPLDVLAGQRCFGQTRDAAESARLPHRRHNLRLLSFH